ncbi:hypothetical protein C2M04_24740 [Serratia marcescens]|nr:hypothetical protein C2M04_24740 [Serratia marcescens]
MEHGSTTSRDKVIPGEVPKTSIKVATDNRIRERRNGGENRKKIGIRERGRNIYTMDTKGTDFQRKGVSVCGWQLSDGIWTGWID